jgi:hypothetical protein
LLLFAAAVKHFLLLLFTDQGPGSPGKRHLSRGGGDEKSAKKMKLSAVGGKPLELIGIKGNYYLVDQGLP